VTAEDRPTGQVERQRDSGTPQATTSRRTVLKGIGAGGGAVALAGLGGGAASVVRAEGNDAAASVPIDRVVRTTCSPNCTGSCGQLAFVRDDRVVKIQQAADFPDAVYNPRGCMKGLSYHHNIHGADRITAPLIRTGERGSGEFREAGWDEVLDRIANEFQRIGDAYGYDSIHVFGQVPGSGYIQKGANYRACAVLGMSHGTSFDFNGDLPMGMPITFGVQNAEHETKDWANSRFLLVVGANPLDTRIPDAHFLFDAADRGARLVVVDPTFSATAAKADTWVQIRPGTDAAFALAMTHVILRDDLADLGFIRTYTDGALLVRTDTGKRLRADEVAAATIDDRGQTGRRAEADDRYVVLDRSTGRIVMIGTERLGFPAGVDPALEGTVTVTLADGGTVDALPAWSLVADEIERWTPERAHEVTGVDPESIRRAAHAYATESPAAILMGGGSNHWFHGDQIGRAYALLATVTGNIGRSGGGFSVYVGQYKVRVDTSPWWSPDGLKAPVVASMYFLRGPTPDMHPDVPYPQHGFKALFCTFSNMFVQSPDLNRLYQTLDELELIVVADPQMTDTARRADIVLPATTWYEKHDLTATPVHPFVQLQQPAIPPVGESRSELWMWREIVRRIDPELAERYFEVDELEAIRMILAAGDTPDGPTRDMTLEALQQGPVRLNVPDPDVPFLRQIQDLEPFPPRSLPAALEATQPFVPTGRIEFYKEEDAFIERGETVPTHLEPQDDGVHDPARYPLALLSPHSKWRIHSTYSNNPWLEEIHGGRPYVLMHPEDARIRGIRDGDEIDVYNGRGSLGAWARVTEAARPGTATLSEGWWPRFFRSGMGVNELTTSEVNPIHEVHYVPNMWSPSTPWKDCRCEVRRV
jgi:anaerobic selenocysteine-containing dehydrogenase